MLLTIAAGLAVGAWTVTGPHASPDVEILARLPGGRVLALHGTGVPSASARLLVVEGGRRAELKVDALPPLPPGRVYQLWFAEPGQTPRTGGAFTVDPAGDAVVQVTIPTPLDRVQAVAVTQEPAPGLVSPTGVHLLDWMP
jgi:anti-sigma-K factor RskA